jgi:hypothetical protein
MSYDLSLIDPVTKEIIECHAHDMGGGRKKSSITDLAVVKVNFGYSAILQKAFPVLNEPHKGTPKWLTDCISDLTKECLGESIYRLSGIRTLYGMSGAESIPMLEDAISQLADDATDNYLEATEGNVKRVLFQLLALARMRPDGIWDGD